MKHFCSKAAFILVGLTPVLALPTLAAEPIPGQGTWETSLQPRDLDNNGEIDAFYDVILDVTWLRDATVHAGTLPSAGNFVGAISIGAFTDWSFPTVDQFDHLWRITLGNRESDFNPGPPLISGLTNSGPFSDLRESGTYWAGGFSEPGLYPTFAMYSGQWTLSSWIENHNAMALHVGNIPEPSTLLLMLVGVQLTVVLAKRKHTELAAA